MKILKESVVPRVGPFYVIGDKIFSAGEPIDSVESNIAGFKDSSNSHYNLWKHLKKVIKGISKYDYDYMPRGRVIYDSNKNKFSILIDKDIDNNDLDNIVNDFSIPYKRYTVGYDSHYKCHLCNSDYIKITEGSDML